MKKLYVLFLFTISLIMHSPAHANAFHHKGLGVSQERESVIPDYCQTNNIRKITRPLKDENSTETFEYSYYYKRNGKNKVTVIYLPGGPGETSIEMSQDVDKMHALFPEKHNVVLTDPRGRGCNYLETTPSDFFSSYKFASDIIALIKDLKLKKYIINGRSYGSALGTIVAHMAENDPEVAAPMALVFEGTIGRGTYEPSTGYIREWNLMKERLDERVISMLSAPVLPFGFNVVEWANFITNQLATDGELLYQRLNMLLSDDPEELEQLRGMIAAVNAYVYPLDFIYLFNAVWCDELAPYINSDLALVGGELIGPTYPAFCYGHTLNLFDSAKYQLKSPIYYVEGSNDPAAFSELSRYHFENQFLAKRSRIVVDGAAHVGRLPLADCNERFWKAVIHKKTKLEKALSKCDIYEKLSFEYLPGN